MSTIEHVSTVIAIISLFISTLRISRKGLHMKGCFKFILIIFIGLIGLLVLVGIFSDEENESTANNNYTSSSYQSLPEQLNSRSNMRKYFYVFTPDDEPNTIVFDQNRSESQDIEWLQGYLGSWNMSGYKLYIRYTDGRKVPFDI